MKKLFPLTAIAFLTLTTALAHCSSEQVTQKTHNELTSRSIKTTPLTPADTSFLKAWKSTTIITEAQVEQCGLERLFTSSLIDDATKARMMGKSYRQDCRVPLSELRILRIVHCNAQGHTQLGEMVCNRLIAPKLLRIFRKLYEAGYRIERIRLIDEYDADDLRSMADNNSSCFCYREVAGTTKLSKHSLGLAVDINTLYNPYVFTRQGRQQVQPIEGAAYAFNRDQRNNIPYKIDHNDLAFQLFKAEGFVWGGDWKSVKDYQHFEYDAQ